MRAASAAALLLAAGGAAAPAPSPEALVARVLARAQSLIGAQRGRDARAIAELDRLAAAVHKELAPLGWRAAAPLGAAARDLSRPPKLRLLAVSFLGLLRDPAAFGPLEQALLDPEQDPDARALAAQSLGGQGLPPAAVSAALCEALAQPRLPREVLDESLLALSRLGCRPPEPLLAAARSFGPRPSRDGLRSARWAIAGLGRSRGDAAALALLELVAYFPPQGEPRSAAIKALAGREAALVRLRPESLPALLEALRSESGRPETMLVLIRLSAQLGPESGDALLRLLRHPDAEVLAAAAEGLAAWDRVDALPALSSIVAGALYDSRFSPRPGRPDPAHLLSRIEAAVEKLRSPSRSEQDMPATAVSAALCEASRLGCPSPAPLQSAARSFDPHQRKETLRGASRAIAALDRSRSDAATMTLLELVSFYPPGGAARAAAIKALAGREESLVRLRTHALPALIEALRSESGRSDTMIVLTRLLPQLGPEGGDALLRLLRHPNPEVLAEAAEGLAAWDRADALPALKDIIAGALKDPRFLPRKSRPAPVSTLSRIKAAAERLGGR